VKKIAFAGNTAGTEAHIGAEVGAYVKPAAVGIAVLGTEVGFAVGAEDGE